LLIGSPIINIVDPSKDFVVCIDIWKGLGGVRTENGHVIFYESRKLKDHESNYDTHELELASIIHALKMCRNYLMDGKFELRIDHSGLEYLFG
jgi:hypothetical protein